MNKVLTSVALAVIAVPFFCVLRGAEYLSVAFLVWFIVRLGMRRNGGW